jgi:F-type H+-transporting ATPase subunit epsilon
MNFFTVDVLTPYNVVARDIPAENVLVPTSRGQINILKEHTHLVTQLDTGELSVFGSEDDPDRFFSISTGICKILKDKVLILANTSEEATDIDVDRATRALENAQSKLKDETLTDEEIMKYRRKVERAQLRLQLATFVRKH